MDVHEIKASLARQGHTLTAIALHQGVTVSSVSKVVHGRPQSFRIARHIAKLLGSDVESIWPGVYNAPRIVSKSRRRRAA